MMCAPLVAAGAGPGLETRHSAREDRLRCQLTSCGDGAGLQHAYDREDRHRNELVQPPHLAAGGGRVEES
jgi:hypothetical protein